MKTNFLTQLTPQVLNRNLLQFRLASNYARLIGVNCKALRNGVKSHDKFYEDNTALWEAIESHGADFVRTVSAELL